YVKGGVFGDQATVYAGEGDDAVYFEDTLLQQNFAVIAGGGTDVLGLNGVSARSETRFFGQTGEDTVLVNGTTFGGNAYIEMGDGDDRFETVGSDYMGRISVRGRIDVDTAMFNDSNSYAFNPNLQTIEAQSMTPNENGAIESSLGQLKMKFIDVGPELRNYTASSMQEGMSDLATAFETSLIQLDVNSVTQYVTAEDPTPSVSVMWDQVVQEAVIVTAPGPTIASRAYAMMHTAMYDAWSAYDADAVSTGLNDQLQRPESENTESNKKAAMSFAAYRVLEDLFADQSQSFENLMRQLGLNPANQSDDVTTPAGIGNRMAEVLLESRHEDGSNQLGDDPSGDAGVAYSDISG
ncbi:DUF6851 domain-containing protein, partial [Rubripirellula obstinata]